jgi:uncharacterized protein (DUF983 family)
VTGLTNGERWKCYLRRLFLKNPAHARQNLREPKIQPMGLLKKGTKAYSILHLKCPKCQEGDLFETGTFSFQKSFDMPEKCPVCGQKYYLEPGFYYGAMFVSYIITGWFCLGFVGLLMLGFGLHWKTSFILLLIAIAVLFVWFFRVARAIWININVKYDPKALARLKSDP